MNAKLTTEKKDNGVIIKMEPGATLTKKAVKK